MNKDVAIIIPTYKECANLQELITRISSSMNNTGFTYEAIVVDDDSNDGSEELIKKLSEKFPVRIIVRKTDRGLSPAVIKGLQESNAEFLLVMDADLSHPPEKIPEMIDMLKSEQADFVIGSRYVEGGSTGEEWGFLRKLNSLGATWLAMPLVRVKDPMSGFFAFKSKLMPALNTLSPIGYKIGLELLVKGDFKKTGEVPIHFVDRVKGESKMTLSEQVRYLRHLRRLYLFKYPNITEFMQFGAVGATGFIVDLAIYLLLQQIFMFGHVAARAISFWFAASWNWALNRLITFSHKEKMPKLLQWPGFLITSGVGFGINVGAYYWLTSYIEYFAGNRILALFVGVILGMGFNFSLSRLLLFKTKKA